MCIVICVCRSLLSSPSSELRAPHVVQLLINAQIPQIPRSYTLGRRRTSRGTVNCSMTNVQSYPTPDTRGSVLRRPRRDCFMRVEVQVYGASCATSNSQRSTGGSRSRRLGNVIHCRQVRLPTRCTTLVCKPWEDLPSRNPLLDGTHIQARFTFRTPASKWLRGLRRTRVFSASMTHEQYISTSLWNVLA